MLSFLFLNFKKKIFVGNNGTLLISTLFFFDNNFIHKTKHILVEEIFILMSIPGLDLIRVTFSRLSEGHHIFYRYEAYSSSFNKK